MANRKAAVVAADVYETTVTIHVTKNGKFHHETASRHGNQSYNAMQTAQGAVVRAGLALGDARMSR